MKYRIKIVTQNDGKEWHTPQVKRPGFFSKWENLLIDDLKHSQTPTRSSRSYSYREYWRAAQDINTHKEKMILDELKKIKEIRYDYK